jgi:outer membrane lipoprotein SlyB
MRLSIATALLSIASFVPAASADTTYYNQHPRYHRTVYRGRHHIRKTVRRVAIGAAGGAAIGAIAGGGPGAAIGAIAGGGAGAIYDHHEKTKGN